jgi:hypothetical protein
MSSNQGISTPTKQKSTYNHPYLIHSSASAVLSRTNTSPSVSYTALPPATPGHRTSKSMGFLRTSQSVDDLRSPEKADPQSRLDEGESKATGGSGYTSYKPPVRRKLVNRYSVSNLSDLAPRDGNDVLSSGTENDRKAGKLDMSVWEWKTRVKAEASSTRELPVSYSLYRVYLRDHKAHCLISISRIQSYGTVSYLRLPVSLTSLLKCHFFVRST